MTDREIYIQVNNLNFEYPDGTQALKDINLEISKGEFIALVGQNGSGKTTLSKCLNGLYKPTSGDLIVDGLNSKSSSIVQMVRRVGYVFQNPDHQLFNSNCWDEIAYGPRNIQLSEDEVKERVEEAIQVVGLPKIYHDEHPFFLSKGLRQRVAIASILALRPQVIIVDEPTTGQDAQQSLEIMDFLKELNEEHGHTIIIITHKLDEVIDISLCLSEYDTKLYVYEHTCPGGGPYACNEDGAGCTANPTASEILGLSVTGGNTYYIEFEVATANFGKIRWADKIEVRGLISQ